jgi:DNA-binding response OmpR family regulator
MNDVAPRARLDAVCGPERDGQGRRLGVLVIEDDPVLRSTLAYNIDREGFRVFTAADGVEGLTLAQYEEPQIDLILLDLMLPRLSGFEVLRQLRVRSAVPILILSARGETQDRIDGLELGADDYIVKPFVLRELMARVRAGIRRRAIPGADPPATLFRGRLRVEIAPRRVFVDDAEIALRRKEYGLLLTLAFEPDRVFSRQELLDRVWGDDVIVDERTVDVHISWLRGKLADAGLDVAIDTVYGAGYRFAANRETPNA